MAYSTQADLEAKVPAQLLVELTDDEQAGTAHAARIARAIDDADAMINGSVRSHYAVPLSPVPPLIRKLSVDLALWELHCRRGPHFDVPEWAKDQHKWALEQLKAIREGHLDLGVEPPPAPSEAVVATTDGPERLFTADTMGGF
jgi:phage gp36-like protein